MADRARVHLHQPHDVTTTGRARTVADALCDHVAIGVPLDSAAAACGVSHTTVRDWLRTGAAAEAARKAGRKRRDLTLGQRRAHDFLVNMRTAMAECEARDVRRLDMLARGGIVLTTVEEKQLVARDADGQETVTVIERKVTTRETLPDLRAITFRLERRFPARWGPTLEVGPDLPGEGRGARDPATAALADAERKVQRVREVRAALGDAIPAASRPTTDQESPA